MVGVWKLVDLHILKQGHNNRITYIVQRSRRVIRMSGWVERCYIVFVFWKAENTNNPMPNLIELQSLINVENMLAGSPGDHKKSD